MFVTKLNSKGLMIFIERPRDIPRTECRPSIWTNDAQTFWKVRSNLCANRRRNEQRKYKHRQSGDKKTAKTKKERTKKESQITISTGDRSVTIDLIVEAALAKKAQWNSISVAKNCPFPTPECPAACNNNLCRSIWTLLSNLETLRSLPLFLSRAENPRKRETNYLVRRIQIDRFEEILLLPSGHLVIKIPLLKHTLSFLIFIFNLFISLGKPNCITSQC